MIEYALTTCNNVVVIPCPKDAVANGHFPQLNFIGTPTSSMSKLIDPVIPIFCKKDLNFSSPIAWPIRTEPIFPERTRICSSVKFEGISLLYSLIGNPAHVIDFGKLINSLSGSKIFSLNAAAIVKVLNTDPNS